MGSEAEASWKGSGVDGIFKAQKGILSIVSNTKSTKPTSTVQLPFQRPQVPSNGDHQALKNGTLGGAGRVQIHRAQH